MLRHYSSCPTRACAVQPLSAQCPWPLQVGSDLTYVFSTESAAAVIKGYSPELIVMPLLPELPVFPVRSEAGGTLHRAQPALNTQRLPVTARHKTMMWGGSGAPGVSSRSSASLSPSSMSRGDPKHNALHHCHVLLTAHPRFFICMSRSRRLSSSCRHACLSPLNASPSGCSGCPAWWWARGWETTPWSWQQQQRC